MFKYKRLYGYKLKPLYKGQLCIHMDLSFLWNIIHMYVVKHTILNQIQNIFQKVIGGLIIHQRQED